VRSGCSETAEEFNCDDDTHGVQSQITFTATANTEYFLFIDAFSDSSAGTYQLNVYFGACPEPADEICDDGIDNDFDGRADCRDFDCDDDPACAEICDDGVDNDADDRIDCDDFECFDHEACIETNCDDGDDQIDCEDRDCDDDVVCQGDDACRRPTPLAQTGTVTVNNESIARQHRGSCAGNGSEVVYALTLRTSGTICVDTLGSPDGFDTVLYARHPECGDEESEVACNDDAPVEGFTVHSQIEFDVVGGDTYFLFADTYAERHMGDFTLNVAAGACP
jgi:hypothetical protein